MITYEEKKKDLELAKSLLNKLPKTKIVRLPQGYGQVKRELDAIKKKPKKEKRETVNRKRKLSDLTMDIGKMYNNSVSIDDISLTVDLPKQKIRERIEIYKKYILE